MHFPPIFEALHEIGYQGGVFVELPRHSHDAPNVARRSYEFLAPMAESRPQTSTGKSAE
jgi:sugar phosphate isomerase/epimerase